MSEFNIVPNRSLSKHGTMMVVMTFSLVLGLLALRFALMGFWLVIPFLLVDLIAVSFAFFFIRKKCCIRECVKIDNKQLLIEHHEIANAQSWDFDLHWVTVDLQEHEHPWQPSRLLVGSHGRWVELARFLTNEERASLSAAIKLSIQKQLRYA